MADAILSDYVYYDPSSRTGLRWRLNVGGRRGAKAGDEAGSAKRCPKYGYKYWQVSICHKMYCCHRVVWEIVTGEMVPDSMEIDHIDGDGSNNSIENLRIVDRKTNGRNLKMHGRNTTGIRGVCYCKKDRAYLANWYGLDGKRRYKMFSCRKYGEQQALDMAAAFRAERIAELNDLGAGYSDRHIG